MRQNPCCSTTRSPSKSGKHLVHVLFPALAPHDTQQEQGEQHQHHREQDAFIDLAKQV
jgi:hypothetical protein